MNKKDWEIKQLGDVCDKASSNVSQNQLDNEVGEYPNRPRLSRRDSCGATQMPGKDIFNVLM